MGIEQTIGVKQFISLKTVIRNAVDEEDMTRVMRVIESTLEAVFQRGQENSRVVMQAADIPITVLFQVGKVDANGDLYTQAALEKMVAPEKGVVFDRRRQALVLIRHDKPILNEESEFMSIITRTDIFAGLAMAALIIRDGITYLPGGPEGSTPNEKLAKVYTPIAADIAKQVGEAIRESNTGAVQRPHNQTKGE